jgi:hypothetical protein
MEPGDSIILYKAALRGNSLESTGLTTEEHREHFEKIKKELAEAPEGSIPYIPWDWAAD